MEKTLSPFFNPSGVVVVGASVNPVKLGYAVARNLVNSGFPGGIHFVSQKAGNLFGRPVYTRLADVPDPVDLAVLIVPAPAVCQALHECGGRGIRAAIIISSGFKEAGPEGRQAELEAVDTAQQYGIRLLGPNCVGLLDTHYPLDSTFLPPPMPAAGDVAFISQSGAICAAIIDWARGQGFGFSRLISLGNQADVNETDMLAAVVEDNHTRVLTLYLESVSDGARFIEEASRVSQVKPVIALKVGRFASGQRAAASHTGALAGRDLAYEAAFNKAGVFRAETSEEMFDWASALACSPLPKGKRMAVLTNAGGPGVIAADALELNGLSLAELAPATRKALTENLPAAAGLNNPIDMLASASPEVHAHCLRLLLADEGVDGVMVILPPPPLHPAEQVAESLISVIREFNKPVVIALMGEALVERASAVLRRARVPEYRFPERAASAMSILVRRAEILRQAKPSLAHFPDVSPERASLILRKYPTGEWISQEDAASLLTEYGIPVLTARLARNELEAIEITKDLNSPVALKIASADILHKSDAGGVVLDIRTPEEAGQAFKRMLERVRQALPQAGIEGVSIQAMVEPGQEVILGAVRDPVFGAMLMFGSGGVEVEGLKDHAFCLAPLSEREAGEMLAETWAGKKLKGYRQIPAVDEKAVIEILQRLSALVCEQTRIQEVEINPLVVSASGAVAVDVRLRL